MMAARLPVGGGRPLVEYVSRPIPARFHRARENIALLPELKNAQFEFLNIKFGFDRLKRH